MTYAAATLMLSALAERLGWIVLHSLWQGLLTAALLTLALHLPRERSAAARHFACLLALSAMLAAMVGTALRSPPQFLRKPPALSAGQSTAGDGAFFAAASAPAFIAPHDAASPSGNAAASTSEIRAEILAANHVARGILPTHITVPWQVRIAPLLQWIAGGWMAGVLLLSLRHLGGWWQVRTLRCGGLAPASAALATATARLAERLHLRRAVHVLVSARATTPMLVGALKPVVLLPAGIATGLRPSELEAVLAHELAHFARGDAWANVFQILAETVLFYHPAVWWIARRARIERENAADDLAVHALYENRLAYAGALARLAEWEAATHPAFALAATDGSLLARIRRIVGQPARPEASGAGWIVATAALLLVAAFLPLRAQDAPPPLVRVAPGESVQAAIDAAAPGSVILLGEGQWKERLVISKPLTLEGAGWEKTIIKPDQLPPGMTPEAKAAWMLRFHSLRPGEDTMELHREYLEKFALPTLLVRNTEGVLIRKLRIGGMPPETDERLGGVLVAFQHARAAVSECAIVGPFSDGVRVAERSDVEIRRSLLAALWGTGILVDGRGDTPPSRLHLNESELRHVGLHAVELAPGCNSSVIERCRISRSGSGVLFDGCSPTILENAFSENGNGIHANGNTQALVQENLFWNNAKHGMECWSDSTDVVQRNTFVANKQAALLAMGEAKPVLIGNIFADSPTAISCGSIGEAGGRHTHTGTPRMIGNLFWKIGTTVQERDAKKPALDGSLSADPQFRDPAQGDFTLAADSPAKQANVGVAAPLLPASPWPALPEERASAAPSATADPLSANRVVEEELMTSIDQKFIDLTDVPQVVGFEYFIRSGSLVPVPPQSPNALDLAEAIRAISRLGQSFRLRLGPILPEIRPIAAEEKNASATAPAVAVEKPGSK